MLGQPLTETAEDREQLTAQSPEPGPPQGWAPIRYLREATLIARFDADAIARASKDRKALFYGACVFGAGAFVSYLIHLPPAGVAAPGVTVSVVALVVAFTRLMTSALSVGIAHGLGKFLLGATGSYVSILRVLWLGFIVSWLEVVPLVGWLAAAVWSLLIMLVTFEEVDGVERLQALGLAVGSGIIMRLAQFMLA